MKVLVADKFEASGIAGLKAIGVDVDYQPELKDDSLQAAIQQSGAEVLVVRSTKVTAPMMQSDQLALIIRAGAGYNTIDVAAASEKGIQVSNCPGKNSQAVAELAFGLIIAADRHIANCAIDLQNGKWNKKSYSKAKGLFGRTLGLVGMGKIGQEMIVRARAFGMNVVAFSRWMTPDIAAALGIGRASSLTELAQMSDFVSVHVSLSPESRGMLKADFFDNMREGAIFINTSRAEVVEESTLLAVLKAGKISAGLDVFAAEPEGGEGECHTELAQLPNVVITHHIGASTEQAQEAVAAETVRIVSEFKLTGTVPNVVNVKRAEVATHVLIVRHIDKPGVLADVLSVLKSEGISVQEMENVILAGAKAAIAQISVDKALSPDAMFRIKGNDNVFDASVFAIEK